MEGLSIIIPVHNKLEMTKRCLEEIKSRNNESEYEIIVFDNGSNDDTEKFLSQDKTIKYIRSEKNLGISGAYNRGAEEAIYPFLCFMHNDVFVLKDNWIKDIINFLKDTPEVGIVGLYGAKSIRKDASYRGKGIVHSKKDNPRIDKPFEEVVGVDGLLMAISKELFIETGGFNEIFTIHYYDKDLSMKAFLKNRRNYVINIPFIHECGTTRKTIPEEDILRDNLKDAFINIYRKYLPCSVMGLSGFLRNIRMRKTQNA